MYEFINFVFKNKPDNKFNKKVNDVRNSLENSSEEINVLDLGAGSRNSNSSIKVQVSKIARTAVSGQLKSIWLYNICAWFKPKFLLEMGTSLGLSGSYLAQNAGKIITLEGNPEIAEIATKTFNSLEVDNTEIIIGNFDTTLNDCLKKVPIPDMVYLDGNHTYEATIRYFNQLINAKRNGEMILIFDDIYWSEGMMKAWKEIQNHEKIRLSIDIYYFGIVFFNAPTIAPKHYTLLPASWKIWHIGFRPVR